MGREVECQEGGLLAEEEVGCAEVHQRVRCKQGPGVESLEVEAVGVERQVGPHHFWNFPRGCRRPGLLSYVEAMEEEEEALHLTGADCYKN